MFGGNSEESIHDIALDPAGNIYVTGRTQDNAGFPVTAGAFQTTKPGNTDAFVSKFNPQGSALIYSTFLGGSLDENNRNTRGGRIAVDAAGNAYIAGETSSANFPTSGNAADATYAADLANPADAFYVKLGPTGAFLYGTFIGGTDFEFSSGIAVDGTGNVYVYGATASDVVEGFPHTPNAYDGTLNQGDVFLQKYDPAGARIYSTLLGGTGVENNFLIAGGGLAIDEAGRAYITGDTYATDFPIVNGYQTTFGGGNSYDVFLAVIDPSIAGAGGLIYSSYLGGNGQDLAYSIAYAGSRQVVVVGEADPNFPTMNALDATFGGGNHDVFIAKFDTAATGAASLVYSTYLGGSDFEMAYDVAVDPQGNVHVVGDTRSADFPQVGALSTIFFLTQPFIAKINAAGTALIYSTYFGAQSNGKMIGAVTTNAIGETLVRGQHQQRSRESAARRRLADGQSVPERLWRRRSRRGDRAHHHGRSRRRRYRRPAERLGNAVRPRSERPERRQRRERRSRRRSRQQRDGAGERLASARVRHHLSRGRRDRHVLRHAARDRESDGHAGESPDALPEVERHGRAALHERRRADARDHRRRHGGEHGERSVLHADRSGRAGGRGSHDDVGQHAATAATPNAAFCTRTATTWYLAEGATHGFFDLFYLIQNPGSARRTSRSPTCCRIRCAPIVQTLTVPAQQPCRRSRSTRSRASRRPTCRRASARPTACRSWWSARCISAGRDRPSRPVTKAPA